MKKNMKKRFLKYLLFSLLLVFTLFFCLKIESNAAIIEKLVSLQGATITWTDRLTNEKISNFVLNNRDLFEDNSDLGDYSFTAHFSYYVIKPSEDIWNLEDLYFKMHDINDNSWYLGNPDFDFWHNSFLNDEYRRIWHNLQPTSWTPTGLLENQAFIDFIQDVCDVEGGIYESVDVPVDNENITGSIFNVFTLISSWISSVVLVVVPIMWTGTELTTLGILAVCGLAVSVILLLIALISRFLKFRG